MPKQVLSNLRSSGNDFGIRVSKKRPMTTRKDGNINSVRQLAQTSGAFQFQKKQRDRSGGDGSDTAVTHDV